MYVCTCMAVCLNTLSVERFFDLVADDSAKPDIYFNTLTGCDGCTALSGHSYIGENS